MKFSLITIIFTSLTVAQESTDSGALAPKVGSAMSDMPSASATIISLVASASSMSTSMASNMASGMASAKSSAMSGSGSASKAGGDTKQAASKAGSTNAKPSLAPAMDSSSTSVIQPSYVTFAFAAILAAYSC